MKHVQTCYVHTIIAGSVTKHFLRQKNYFALDNVIDFELHYIKEVLIGDI